MSSFQNLTYLVKMSRKESLQLEPIHNQPTQVSQDNASPESNKRETKRLSLQIKITTKECYYYLKETAPDPKPTETILNQNGTIKATRTSSKQIGQKNEKTETFSKILKTF